MNRAVRKTNLTSPRRTQVLTGALLLSAVLVACSEPAVSLGDDDAGAGADHQAPPDATETPDAPEADDAGPVSGVDLVVVAYPGSCPVSPQWDAPLFEATVRNLGDQSSGPVQLRLTACADECDAADPRHTLFQGTLPDGLAPGAAHTFRELMPPLPSSPIGAWQVRFSVDPEDSVPEVDETNNSSQPYALHNGLRVVPESVDFGSVCVGHVVSTSVRLENVGGSPIEITGAHRLGLETSRAFEVVPLGTPVSLAPGSTMDVDLSFAPTDAGPARAMFWFDWSLSACALVVDAAGSGLSGAQETQVFQQRAEPHIDVLVVIDDSGSMIDDEPTTLLQLPRLYDALVSEGVDFHLGVTTTDIDAGGEQGALIGTPSYLDRNTANAGALWASRIDVGTLGSGLDQGLEASRLALSPPRSTTDNAGFLRPDASLLVLFVSDENDGSAAEVAVYRDFFEASIGEAEQLRVDAIVSMPGSNCGDEATRYLEIVNDTAGAAVDICGLDWGPALINPSRDGLGLRDHFPLAFAQNPPSSALTVMVEGNVVPDTEWTYDPNTQRLSFTSGSIPAAGATIEVRAASICL